MKTKLMRCLAVAGLSVCAQAAMAQMFNAGIPAGWTSTGTTGTLGADGVVTASPAAGSTAYGYVSSLGGVTGVSPFSTGVETNGSSLLSTGFSANSGDPLSFYFNYVTSDGAGFSDYGWAVLKNASDSSIAAVLFTARTQPTGNIVPGFGLPAITATLTPPTSPIIPGGPVWSALGGSSGDCYDDGCGYTGWIQASYVIPTAGSYLLEFGVVNALDQIFDSGMAFDGITVAGTPITPSPTAPIPEPETYAMLLAGLGVLSAVARRRRKAAS